MMHSISIYCDDGPDAERGGFSSVLGNIFNSECLPDELTLHTSSADYDKNLLRSNRVVHWWFLGNRGISYPSWVRFPLILIDVIIGYCCRLNYLCVNKCSAICVFVGSDWTSILRGLVVAKALKTVRRSVYVVDNIFDLASINNTLQKRFVIFLLRKFDKRIAITDALASNLSLITGLSWDVAALPYDFSVVLNKSEDVGLSVDSGGGRNILVFVGAISPYVAPMLNRLIDILIESAGDLEPRLELHVISQKIPSNFTCENRDAISSGLLKTFTGIGDSEIRRNYRKNGVFICPYSDLSEHSKFVSESFPSKLLKMLQSDIPCIVMAPPHASVCRVHGFNMQTVHLKDSIFPLLVALEAISGKEGSLNESIEGVHEISNFLSKAFHG